MDYLKVFLYTFTMNKNLSTIIVSVCIIVSAIFLSLTYFVSKGKIENPVTSFSEKINKSKTPTDNFAGKDASDKFAGTKQATENKDYLYSLLVLGNDKRYDSQQGFRTDTIMVITINKNTNKVLFTSIPRDTYINKDRINAAYIVGGIEEINKQVTTITGLKINNYAMIDFAHFVDLIDAVGGVKITVPVGFTDETYPNDRQGGDGIHTVTITAGEQVMDGETALIYSRSRKGSNGQGSDFKRMERQQQILKVLPASFFQARNLETNNAKAIYTKTTQLMEIDLTFEEFEVLFDMLKDHNKYTFENLVLSTSNYMYNPPLADYGGAYVLRPNDESYQEIRLVILKLID